MDHLDIKIFCEMGFKYHPPYSRQNRHPSFSTIARSLGVDVRTVKARISKFERDGFVTYYQALPNYNTLSLSSSSYALRFGDALKKKAAIDKVKRVEEVTQIIEMVNMLVISILYPGAAEEESAVKTLARICGSDPMKAYDTKMPFISARLNATDWRIIKSLRNDALKPSAKVAQELGVTSRAVNYRMERLVENRAFFVIPVLDMRKVSKLFLYMLILFVDDSLDRSETVAGITQSFGAKSFLRIVNQTGAIVFGMFAERIGEPEENYRKAMSLRGVREVILEYTLETHDCPALLDKMIEEKIASQSVKV